MRRLLAVILLAAMQNVAAQNTFHGNHARTGVYASPGPTKLSGIRWTFKTAGPIVSSAAVAEGVVYIASYDGFLYAIDQETGREKWKYKSRMPIASSPAVDGGTVYFVSSAGALAAIELATGKPKWVFVTEFERKFEARNLHGLLSSAQTIPDAWDVFISSPAVADGKVYFGSGDGNAYAADAQSGSLQWKFATNDVVHASPAVVNNTVYIGS
jgi:eukaryotic-like serine/threonine-protein kinase